MFYAWTFEYLLWFIFITKYCFSISFLINSVIYYAVKLNFISHTHLQKRFIGTIRLDFFHSHAAHLGASMVFTFKCSVCSFETDRLLPYSSHYRLHRNVPNFNFPCAFPNCIRTFKSYAGFRSHFFRDHSSNNVHRVPYCKSTNPKSFTCSVALL